MRRRPPLRSIATPPLVPFARSHSLFVLAPNVTYEERATRIKKPSQRLKTGQRQPTRRRGERGGVRAGCGSGARGRALSSLTFNCISMTDRDGAQGHGSGPQQPGLHTIACVALAGVCKHLAEIVRKLTLVATGAPTRWSRHARNSTNTKSERLGARRASCP